MDPNETLKKAREAVNKVNAVGISGPGGYWAFCDFLTAFEKLDKWLLKGGVLPEDWKPKTT